MKNLIILLLVMMSTSINAQDLYIGYGESAYKGNIAYDIHSIQVFGDFKENPFIIGAIVSGGETIVFGPEKKFNSFRMLAGMKAMEFKDAGTEVAFLTSNTVESVNGKLQAIDLGMGASLRFKVLNQIYLRGSYNMSAYRYSRGLDNIYNGKAFSRHDSYSVSVILKLTQN